MSISFYMTSPESSALHSSLPHNLYPPHHHANHHHHISTTILSSKLRWLPFKWNCHLSSSKSSCWLRGRQFRLCHGNHGCPLRKRCIRKRPGPRKYLFICKHIVVIHCASTIDRSINVQVVDSCMVEGAAYVGSWLFASRDMFVWGQPRYWGSTACLDTCLSGDSPDIVLDGLMLLLILLLWYLFVWGECIVFR